MKEMQILENDTPSFSTGYRYYAVGLLALVYAFNFMDRQAVVILQEAIKTDLHLMDWQLGLLSGFAFAIFYTVLGLPIAAWADKGNRRNIIALAITVWSGMTAVCGLAQSFWQLLLARVGVGSGEAGCSPPAHSIISDMFPPTSRATAMATYNVGVYVGILFGYLAGGWINEYLGWRAAFVVIGLPGVLVALVVRFTLREPPRGMSEQLETVADAPSVFDVIKLLWSRPSFRHLAWAGALHAFIGYGVGNWAPSFLIRSHGMATGEIANWLAPISAFGGGAGALLGGYYADKYGVRDARWYVWIPAASIFIATPFGLFFYLSSNTVLALSALIFPVFLGATYLGPMLAVTHGLVAPRMRAVASSILFLVLNLVGMGLGPWLTGLISDLLTPRFGSEGLRLALVIVSLLNIWCVIHYFISAKQLRQDLARAPK